jgi:hypothetical protein
MRAIKILRKCIIAGVGKTEVLLMNPENEPRTPQEEAFYREWKNKPLTPEEVEFFKNPGELVPMRELIVELEEIAKKKKDSGAGR